jgi:hypothetical protein
MILDNHHYTVRKLMREVGWLQQWCFLHREGLALLIFFSNFPDLLTPNGLPWKLLLWLNSIPLFWLMTNLTHSFLMYLFYASICFEQQVLITRRAELY